LDTNPAIVLIDSDRLRRNDVARLFYYSGRHVEPYESFEELRAFWPEAGIVLLHDDDDALRSIFDLMLDQGCWLPVIAYATDPLPARIVDVILMGAMDYFEWPIGSDELGRRLELLTTRKTSLAELRRKATRSQRLVDRLSDREREVLFGLARGATNKTMARELRISPRTIEIHRSNMMIKLGVQHLGEAITIALYADLASFGADEDSAEPFAAPR
jgi:FixJ family two-component response regulator